jgi:hypothetical protein
VTALFDRLADADADAGTAAPFDARTEAGDAVPHLACLVRRTTPRIAALLKTAEANPDALQTLGALLRLDVLLKERL